MSDLQFFSTQLTTFRQHIDQQIAKYIQNSDTQVKQTYNLDSQQAWQSYTAILGRGGKRLRGALTILAYQIFGGSDEAIALQAALVIEMVQAYVLIIDDVCDQSELRRGGPTAHRLMSTAHQRAGWREDSDHFGQSIATLAAVLGLHQALLEADKLTVEPAVKLAALHNLNYCLSITAHGQFNDIYVQVKPHTDLATIEQILTWKTAYYSFISPLQFGALLAGASTEACQSVVDFSLAAGKVFQLTDDLLGTFGSSNQTGKSQLDDIREGKRTLQVVLAMQQASKADGQFLLSMLGNQSLTVKELEQCQHIIKNSGAYDQIIAQVAHNAALARQALETIEPYITPAGIQFLSGMITYLESRQS